MKWFAMGLAVSLFGVGGLVLAGAPDAAKKDPKKKDGDETEKSAKADYRISGPFTHKNLTVFLIHGEDRVKDKTFITLQEALAQKKVIVHETGDVQELAVENVSKDDVYIQSGEIVKGGQQDRVLTVDVILPAKSGKVPIASYCVEHGRWSKRGAESVAQFDSSTRAVSSKSLKLAVKKAGSQSEVWEKVAEEQAKLSANTGEDVRSGKSESSYQLALENKTLKATTQEYTKALQKAVLGEKDVIGYAFSINGELSSADVYANHELFTKLWPKLIQSSAVEAVSELDGKKNYKAPAKGKVLDALTMKGGKKSSSRAVSKRVKMDEHESDDMYMFESVDLAEPAAAADEDGESWVHRNYIAK